MPTHESHSHDQSRSPHHEEKKQGISFRPPTPKREEKTEPLPENRTSVPEPFSSVQMKRDTQTTRPYPGKFSAIPSVIQGVFERGRMDQDQRQQLDELIHLIQEAHAVNDEFEGQITTYRKTADHTLRLRKGNKRNVTYRSNTNINFDLTVYLEEDEDTVIDVAAVGYVREGRNLKDSRTDVNEYRWIGNEVDGMMLGMSESRRVASEDDVPADFYESHLSGKHGVRYFKQVDPSRMNTQMPGFVDLVNSGRDLRYVKAAHQVPVEERDSANSVMGTSATQYANHIANIRDDGDVRVTGNFRNGISYEWCHLIGHGDGGQEVPANFVSGSHYANTEQLAIETGLRRFRDLGLELRVWAFFPQVREGIQVDAYFADYVVYDILHQGQEIFSHTFSLHSPSFDLREWNMLQADVEEKLRAHFDGQLAPEKNEELGQSRIDMMDEATDDIQVRRGRSTKNFERDLWGFLSKGAEDAMHGLKGTGAQLALQAQQIIQG